MKAYDMMLAACRAEEALMNLRKLACEGSFLKGHTVNEAKAKGNRLDIRETLQAAKAAIEQAINDLGDPRSEGYAAGTNGRYGDENPYPASTEAFNEWEQGRIDGMYGEGDGRAS